MVVGNIFETPLAVLRFTREDKINAIRKYPVFTERLATDVISVTQEDLYTLLPGEHNWLKKLSIRSKKGR